MTFIQEFMHFFHTHLIETLVLGIFALFGWVAKRLIAVYSDHLKLQRKKIEEETAEQDLLKQGMLALLRFRINRICYKIKEQGYLEIDDKTDLDDMFKAYTALGGNGRTHIMYEETLKLPIK